MPCTKPLQAWQSKASKQIVFVMPHHSHLHNFNFLTLPCGQCIACRLSHSRQWATRMVHENHMHDSSCFLTLTYNNANLPPDGSLVKEHLTKFFKRYRKSLGAKKIRYFACGEYGSKLFRPHYHAVIFGHDFPDKKLHQAGKFPLYTSLHLQSLWFYGFSVIAAFSFESAAYVARYCVKKVNGKLKDEHYGGRIPEYSVMSRRPGLGADFFYKFYDDIVNQDRVISRGGRQSMPPKYYDKLLSGCDLELLEANKEKRIANAKVLDPWRLQDLDKFNLVKFQRMMRKLENDNVIYR